LTNIYIYIHFLTIGEEVGGRWINEAAAEGGHERHRRFGLGTRGRRSGPLTVSDQWAPGSLAPWLILGSWLLAPGSWLLGSLCPEGSNVPVRKTDALPSKTTDLITTVFGVFLVSQFLDVTVVS